MARALVGVPDRLETRLVPERFGLIRVNAAACRARAHQAAPAAASVAGQRRRAAAIRRNAIDVVFSTGGLSPPPRWRPAGAAFPWFCMNPMPSGRVTRCWVVRSAVAIGHPLQPSGSPAASRLQHAGAFQLSGPTTPARLGPYRQRPTVGGHGRQSRRRWPQPDGACRCANPLGPSTAWCTSPTTTTTTRAAAAPTAGGTPLQR